MNNWKIGSNGPMCKVCNQLTSIGTIDHENGTKKGWPVLICYRHDNGVMAGGRPIPLAGMRTTCPSPEYDVASGYWYLPKHIPHFTYRDGECFRTPGTFNWEKVEEWEVGMILKRGKREYEFAKRSFWTKVGDFFANRNQY